MEVEIHKVQHKEYEIVIKLLKELYVELGETKNWGRIDVTAPTEQRWARTVSFYESAGFVYTGPKLKLIL